MSVSPKLVAGTSVLATGAAMGFGWAAFERHWMRLSRITVPAHPDAPELKILHISDLHLTTRTDWIVDFVRSLADLKPDFVVSTGDNFNSRDALEQVTRAYEPLLEFPGAFVLGSHDFYSPYSSSWSKYLRKDSRKIGDRKRHRIPDLPTEQFTQLLTSNGWVNAQNRAEGVWVETAAGKAGICLVGTGDAHENADSLEHIGLWPDPPLTAEDSGTDTPSSLSQTAGTLKLALTHAPYQRVLNAFTQAEADLIVAGHTHGGQLCVPFYGALVTNCDLPRSYASGLGIWPPKKSGREQLEDTDPAGSRQSWLHVSAGLGTTYQAPFRFACRPTATLLELDPGPRG
ncbi:metallophosphoesterase [Boudabousia marimammalium]|uniref:Calcineurin-like phosphoesterase domain-containing protein n=1 Tax=Boudabousia marimammalium TaxID=156892 RepID=A0A1Q5PSS3_9ACTO|nr:metallophosphoesterase [Boudabousia marimammalium]OKL50631.1 hypothetical protein BM477_01380 [Boudabousia marimammalium]